MIDLLGIGVPRADGGRLLHQVCSRIPSGALTAVVSRQAEERLALLDSVTGRRVPEEGRVWVGGVPVMGDTVRRLRCLVADVDLDAPLMEHRSVLWNTLAALRPGLRILQGLLGRPRPSQRWQVHRALVGVGLESSAHERVSALPREARARLATARELVRRPEYIVIREVDVFLGEAGAAMLLRRLQALARTERLAVLVSVAEPSLALSVTDRIIAIADGQLVFDGPPELFSPSPARRRVTPRS